MCQIGEGCMQTVVETECVLEHGDDNQDTRT